METDFEAQVSMETEILPTADEPPFRALLLGDYSGRANLEKSTDANLPESRPIEIDKDEFETVMKRLNVSLRLHLQEDSSTPLILNFRELDDFHPDRIFQQISLFSDLRDVRKRLLDSNTFERAAGEVRSWFVKTEEEDQKTDTESETDETEENFKSTGNLLDDVLGFAGKGSSTPKPQTAQSLELSNFIQDLVEPHLVRTDEVEQEKLLALVDESTSSLMRQILHHPEFQALEAAWRGLYLLVRKVETSTELKLFVLDISKAELLADLKSSDDLTKTKLYQIMVTNAVQTQGGDPWTVVCGDYEFNLNVDDAATLIRLAKLAASATAPFIAQIKPQMLGIESFAETPDVSDWNVSDDSNEGKLWTALRTMPEAGYLGLIAPRFLTRLPYGEETEPTEVFLFEEFTGGSQHENYLWANSGYVCVLLLAQSFSKFGWEMRQNLFQNLDGLPVHLYKNEQGETKTKPCAEIEMTHRACDVLLEQGLMPLISFRDTDRVRLADFQSVAFPSKHLSGRWS